MTTGEIGVDSSSLSLLIPHPRDLCHPMANDDHQRKRPEICVILHQRKRRRCSGHSRLGHMSNYHAVPPPRRILPSRVTLVSEVVGSWPELLSPASPPFATGSSRYWRSAFAARDLYEQPQDQLQTLHLLSKKTRSGISGRSIWQHSPDLKVRIADFHID